jgi:hypothetical protein
MEDFFPELPPFSTSRDPLRNPQFLDLPAGDLVYLAPLWRPQDRYKGSDVEP